MSNQGETAETTAARRGSMRLPPLVKRRSVPLPTIWGWLLIAVIFGTAGLLVVRSLHPYLSTTKPNRTGILVVEGWLPDYALAEARDIFKSGNYAKLLTTGGPLEKGSYLESYPNLAVLASSTLRRMGLPDSIVISVPSEHTRKDRTYVTACSVRSWLASNAAGITTVDLVSLGAHSRRSRDLFDRAFGGEIKVGIIAVEDQNYDPHQWWKSSAGVRTVIGEALALLYVSLVFDSEDI